MKIVHPRGILNGFLVFDTFRFRYAIRIFRKNDTMLNKLHLKIIFVVDGPGNGETVMTNDECFSIKIHLFI